MSVSKFFTNFALKLHTLTAQAGGAVSIEGITDLTLNSELQTLTEATDGAVYDSYGSLVSGKPSFTFTTKSITALLAQCGLEGMLIDSDGLNPGVACYMQRMAQGGTRDAQASGTHFEVVVANGLMLLDTLTLTSAENATLAGRVLARQAGAVAPLQFNASANLPDVYPALDEAFTVGPVKLSGADIGGVASISTAFGISELAEGRDGDIYPTFIGIQNIKPGVSITGAHIDVLDTLTPDGKFYTAANVEYYGRKREEGGTLVADATAEHLKFTCGKCRVEWESVSGDPKEINLKIIPLGTPGATPVSPIAISTASAIT